MPSFKQNHDQLLGLSKLRKPTKSYCLDYTFTCIDEVLSTQDWDKEIDGPILTSEPIDSRPEYWYTQYWWNCTVQHLCADFDGYELHEVCDYQFDNDETIITGSPLDQY